MNDNLPDRMLQLMSDGAWHSTKELVEKVSHRFSATKHVLSKRGYKFEKRRVEDQQHEYRLVVKPRVIA
jgi:hypothetical protein